MRDDLHPEAPDVAVGPVVWTGLGFLGFVAASVAGLLLYFHLSVTGPSAVPPRTFPAPQVRADTRQERLRLEARQAAELRDYGWVDRAAGLAHIPIEDAMALVAAKGDRAFEPLDQATPEPQP